MAAPCIGASLMGKRVRLHSLNSIVYNDMLADVIGWDHSTNRCVRAAAIIRTYTPHKHTTTHQQLCNQWQQGNNRASCCTCTLRAHRFMVKLDGSGKELKVKPENMVFEDPADAPLAAMAASMSDR